MQPLLGVRDTFRGNYTLVWAAGYDQSTLGSTGHRPVSQGRLPGRKDGWIETWKMAGLRPEGCVHYTLLGVGVGCSGGGALQSRAFHTCAKVWRKRDLSPGTWQQEHRSKVGEGNNTLGPREMRGTHSREATELLEPAIGTGWPSATVPPHAELTQLTSPALSTCHKSTKPTRWVLANRLLSVLPSTFISLQKKEYLVLFTFFYL